MRGILAPMPASGSHLHLSVYVDGQSVDLSHWAEEQQAGMHVLSDAGGKDDLSFFWDNEAGALVNTGERIALRRLNVPDSTQSDGMRAENWAYAWEEGKSMDEMKRVVWYTNEDAGFAGWLQIDAAGKFIKDQNNRPLQWIPSSSEKWLPVIINL